MIAACDGHGGGRDLSGPWTARRLCTGAASRSTRPWPGSPPTNAMDLPHVDSKTQTILVGIIVVLAVAPEELNTRVVACV